MQYTKTQLHNTYPIPFHLLIHHMLSYLSQSCCPVHLQTFITLKSTINHNSLLYTPNQHSLHIQTLTIPILCFKHHKPHSKKAIIHHTSQYLPNFLQYLQEHLPAEIVGRKRGVSLAVQRYLKIKTLSRLSNKGGLEIYLRV